MNIGNVVSAFDGYSSAQIALNELGYNYDNYFASEICPHAIKVTQSNFPKTIQVGDITKIDASKLPKITLLCGGSPCQGFSFAGKKLNFNDPRSKLFFEFVRLKNELTPQYFFLENVPMDTRSQNIISDFLECEPIVINSKLVSAQDRERLYWTNLPFSKPNNSNILLCDIVGFNSDIPYNLDEIRGEISKLTKREFGFSISKSGRIRPYRFDVSKSGISEVGTIVNPYDKSTTLIKSQVPKTYHSNPFRIHELTRNECEMLQNVPIGYTDAVSENKAKEMLGNGWTVGIIKQFFMNLNSSPISRKRSMSLFAIG